MAKPISRRILRELDRHQLDVISHRSKRHHVIRVRAQSGSEGVIVLASSPSDHRASRNGIAQIKRTAKTLAEAI